MKDVTRTVEEYMPDAFVREIVRARLRENSAKLARSAVRRKQ